MKRIAAVYEREDKIIVVPERQLKCGLREDKEPARVLDSRDPAAIGNAVLAALNEYETDFPDHDFRDLPKPSIPARALGLKTEKAFMKGTRHCGVSYEGDTFTAKAWENDGRGFDGTGMEPLSASIPGGNPTDVGNLVLAALKAATFGKRYYKKFPKAETDLSGNPAP